MYKKLLVGYDGSTGARAALYEAIALAKVTGAEVWALWVRETVPYFVETLTEVKAEEEAAHPYLDKLKAELQQIEKEKGIPIQFHAHAGHAAQNLVRYATEGSFDLIVLGSSGRSEWGGLLGHTTDRVSEHATCNVLIVRTP